jgi:AcrR family transcriptional regulator
MEQAKKDCILSAAAKCFAKLGFKKASVEEIAKDAGVAKGTVYLACDSKEDLFYQAVHREVRAWIGQMSKLVDPRVGADDLLRGVAELGVVYLEEHALVRDLFLGIYHGLLPGWADRLDELRALGGANAQEILRLGIRQGKFRADLDVEQTATILQDIQIATLMWHAREQAKSGSAAPIARERLQRRARAALDLVLNGVRARDAAALA